MGSTGTRSPDDPPPAALARQVDDGRRRELAHALHQPHVRASRITERLDEMRVILARYRAEAIALHARFVALEIAGNDNIAALRRALIASSVQIEDVARMLVDTTVPARWPKATVEIDEWPDEPTLERVR
ncbi:MAG: hypothetical protein H0V17_12885 [Deltaproteobacteria bacterium]|nr:hypothetical protein [Deltaproteobacteria bacterium]